jgi:hypothetical protein
MANIALGLLFILIVITITVRFYLKRKKQTVFGKGYVINTFEELVTIVLRDFTEIIKPDRGLMKTSIEYEASLRNKSRIAQAARKCVYGEENARRTIIKVFHDIIASHLLTLESCYSIFNFEDLETLPPEIKFEILLYCLAPQYGKNAVKFLNDTYKWSSPRYIAQSGLERREVDYALVDTMFKEQMPYDSLSYEQCIDVISILVYQNSKGYGKIDTLMQQNIDGLELGTVGAIRYRLLNANPDYVTERSCSIQLDAQWIHLSFINFGTVDEIKRLVLNVSNTEGSEALTIKRPTKVVDMYNGSRVTCIRPNVGATWGLFVRSFSAGVISVKKWLDKPEVKNWEIVDKLLFYLCQCTENTAVTGQQNTGKTTLMKGLIGYYPYFNIRVIEMSFELQLNEIYPDRNIFCTRNDEFTSATEVQDILKKTDGYLSMAGEIATNEVAANAMQFGLVASQATMFSHHGKDYMGLIEGLTNALLSSGQFNDRDSAQGLVLDVVKHNVHCDFHKKLRVVDYIEEIVKGETIVPYQDIKVSSDVVSAIDQSTALNREFYQRTTDRVRYTSRKIIRFNHETNTYEPYEWYTPERFAIMLDKMPDEHKAGFIQFYKDNWVPVLKARANSGETA